MSAHEQKTTRGERPMSEGRKVTTGAVIGVGLALVVTAALLGAFGDGATAPDDRKTDTARGDRAAGAPAWSTLPAADWAGRYALELRHLVWLIGQALQHSGYALVDVLQPCVSFNRASSYDFYKSRVYKLEDDEDYDPEDRTLAWVKSQEWGERIPIGIVYQGGPVLPYEEQLPALKEGPLVARSLIRLRSEHVAELQAEVM